MGDSVIPPITDVHYRVATSDDVPAILRDRLLDPTAGPGDGRMAAYLDGNHHPQQALAPRVLLVAEAQGRMVGYAGGHLTRRFGCDGELQYLFVTTEYRRHGIARELVTRLARWFCERDARRVCVNVNAESPEAEPFYQALGASALGPHWMVWDDIHTLVPQHDA